jgi:amino acid transporter
LWAGYKLVYKTRVIPADKVDLITGLRAIDEEEKRYLADEATKGPQSKLRKFWDSL